MSVQELYDGAFALRCDGRYGEAKAAFEKVLTLEPGHVKSQWQLALILGFEGDFDGSLESLRSLSVAHPGDLDVLNDLGMTAMMLGEQDEACAAFHRILSVNPEHENALRQSKYC